MNLYCGFMIKEDGSPDFYPVMGYPNLVSYDGNIQEPQSPPFPYVNQQGYKINAACILAGTAEGVGLRLSVFIKWGQNLENIVGPISCSTVLFVSPPPVSAMTSFGEIYIPPNTPMLFAISAEVCGKTFASPVKFVLFDNYGYQDSFQVSLPVDTIEEFNGAVPSGSSAIQVIPSQPRGRWAQAYMRALDAKFIKPGFYSLKLAGDDGVFQYYFQWLVGEGETIRFADTVYPIPKPVREDDSVPALGKVEMSLPKTTCPEDDPEVSGPPDVPVPVPPPGGPIQLPEGENPPGPAPQPQPQPQPQTETEPSSPPPSTSDPCCAEVVGGLNRIKEALWANQRALSGIEKQVQVGLGNLAEQLKTINDNLYQIGLNTDPEKNQCICAWLEEIAKSLITGQENEGGHKERIADLIASILNAMGVQRYT